LTGRARPTDRQTSSISPNESVEGTFDVFLSHNGADKASVLEIATRLRAAGVEPFIDVWHLIPGEPWQEALEEALDRSRSCAVFVGPGGLGTWENEEMRTALSRRASDADYRVIPVLLPDATLPERGRLPHFLARLTWVDFRPGLDDSAALDRLVAGIRGVAPDTVEEDAVNASKALVCPFRGLEVFDEDHAEYFFGREALTQYLVEQLRSDRFLAVIGPSGSGKSSVVRAGLVPALRRGTLPGSDRWPVAIVRPGARPMDALAARLAPQIPGSDDVLSRRSAILTLLGKDERGLHSTAQVALAGMPLDRRLVVLVDQFEEIFTLCHDEAERRAFVASLLYASTIAGGQACIVITMRADFFGKCAIIPGLAARLADRDVLVPPMEHDELRRAMVSPAERVGLQFEKGLVETILADLGTEPGALPLLQHTLFELFVGRRERWLTVDRYHAIGGVRGAIASRAEAVYSGLSPAQQAMARRLLMRLTQPGEGTEDTRRRTEVSELVPTDEHGPDVEAVLHELTDARLLTTSRADTGGDVVDVAHEALIRGWPRLQAWLEEDPNGMRIHRRLTEAAEEWGRAGEEPGFLFRGRPLIETESWSSERPAELNDLERRFLEASRSARAAEKRAKTRRTQGLFAGVIVVAVVLAALWQNAASERAAAQQAGALAQARYLAAEGERMYPTNPLLGVRLVLEAVALEKATRSDAPTTGTALGQLMQEGKIADLGSGIARIDVSPDGRMLLVARTGGGTELRSSRDGRLIETYDTAFGASFVGPAGSWVAVEYVDHTDVRLPDGSNMALTHPAAGFFFSQVDPISDFVVTYGDPSIGDVPASELRRTLDGSVISTLPSSAIEAVFSPDPGAKSFFVRYYDHAPELRRTSDGALLAELVPNVDTVTFMPEGEGTFLMSSTSAEEGEAIDAELRLTADGRLIGRFAGAQTWATSFDSSNIILGYFETKDTELRTTGGQLVAALGRVEFGEFRAASPVTFVVWSNEGPAELRRAADGNVLATFPAGFQLNAFDPDQLDPVSFSRDPAARYLLLSYSDHIDIRDAISGSPIALSTATRDGECQEYTDSAPGPPVSVEFSPDDDASFFVVRYANGMAELRRTVDASLVESNAGFGQAWFPEGTTISRFVVADDCGNLEVRDAEGREVVAAETPIFPSGANVMIGPDGRFAFVAQPDPNSMNETPIGSLLDLATGKDRPTSGAVDVASWSANGKLGLIRYADGRSELWSTEGNYRRLSQPGLGVEEAKLLDSVHRVVIRTTTGGGYIVDTRWLAEMPDDVAGAKVDDLIPIACSDAVSGAIEGLDEVLQGAPARACVSQGLP